MAPRFYFIKELGDNGKVIMAERTVDTKTLVIKYGGTSVGSAEAIQQVIAQVQLAREEWKQVVVVLSANVSFRIRYKNRKKSKIFTKEKLFKP